MYVSTSRRSTLALAPASLLSILGVLRRPRSPGDEPPRRPFGRVVGLYVNYVRFARSAQGRRWYVWVDGGPWGLLPPANIARCLTAQQAAFRSELPTVPPSLRAPTTRLFNEQLRGERRAFLHHPPGIGAGVTLAALSRSGGFGGGGADAAQIVHQGMWISEGGGTGADPGRTLFAGIVPDGVATVTLHYPAGKLGSFSHRSGPAITVTARAVNNVVVVAVERAGQQAVARLTATWRSADGSIVKTLHGNL